MSRSLLLACLVFGARALAPRSWARAGSLRSVLTMKAAPVAELARDVDAFSRKNQVIKIIASDAERAAVAKRLDVESIEELVANVTLASQRRDLVVCDGAVRASIVRAEGDAAARVDGCEFRVLVAADESVERALFDGEVDADVEVADDYGMIDVGELVVQARERERETVARTLSPPPSPRVVPLFSRASRGAVPLPRGVPAARRPRRRGRPVRGRAGRDDLRRERRRRPRRVSV